MPGYKDPPVQYQFKPGQSGNPAGRAIEDPAIARLRKLTKEELASCASWLLKGTLADIEKVLKDPSTTLLQRMVAAVAGRIISKGDPVAWSLFLDRIIGKVKEVVEQQESNVKIVVTLPSNGFESKPLEVEHGHEDGGNSFSAGTSGETQG